MLIEMSDADMGEAMGAWLAAKGMRVDPSMPAQWVIEQRKDCVSVRARVHALPLCAPEAPSR